MANFQPDLNVEYDGKLLNGTDLLYDTTQGVRIWGDATQDNYSIGDTTTSGVDATYGTNNLAFGQNALNSVQATGSTKSSNIGIGTYSLSQLSSTASLGTSNDNIAIGTNTGKFLKKGTTNILIGKDVLATYSSTTLLTSSVFIGTSVAKFPTTVGNTNTAVGSGLLSSTGLLSVGSNNTLLGSLIASTATVTSVGSSSVFIGSNIGNGSFTSLPSQTVYIGYTAGNTFTSTSAANSVYVGYLAGQTSLANTFDNVVIGSQANSLGNESVVLGSGAGSNIATSAAVSNIIIGFSAGSGITSGNSNIIIGPVAGGDISSGSGNIIIAGDYGGQAGSNNIDILTNAGTTGIQFTNSTNTLTLKATKVSVPNGFLLVDGTTTDNIPIQFSPTISFSGAVYTTSYGSFFSPSIMPTTANLTGVVLGSYIRPQYNSNFIPNNPSSHYSALQLIAGATTALTSAIPDVRGLTIAFNDTQYAATTAPLEYTHLRLTDPLLNGSTATYNIYSGSNSATNKWNIYAVGTAPNHILSKILLGSTTDAGTGEILQVTGSALVSSNFKVAGVQINTSTKANTAWLASGTANSTTFLRGDGTWATATGTATTPSIARTFALMGA